MLMKIDSWSRRGQKRKLLESLERYDDINLSTFASNERILQKHISLAACSFGAGLHDEGMDRITKANSIGIVTEEVEEVKALLGEDYLQNMVKKALIYSTPEQMKILRIFCSCIDIEVRALTERLERV